MRTFYSPPVGQSFALLQFFTGLIVGNVATAGGEVMVSTSVGQSFALLQFFTGLIVGFSKTSSVAMYQANEKIIRIYYKVYRDIAHTHLLQRLPLLLPRDHGFHHYLAIY